MIQNSKTKYKIKLVDLTSSDEVFYETEIKSKELISRLKCEMYTVLDGHIYYDNKVIKIRYDLIRQGKIKEPLCKSLRLGVLGELIFMVI